MKIFPGLVFFLGVALFFLACVHAPERISGQKLPRYDRNGMEITDSGPPPPTPPPGTVYRAVASWYGPGFDGRRTASGDIFDQDALTAAHRTYPFGTKLRITNPKNGKSCEITVNDRGPFIKGVDIDISRGASRAIGCLSTRPVLLEELGRDMGYVKEARVGEISGGGPFRVQLGSFQDPDNAAHLKEGLEISYKDVRITRVKVGGKTYNRVQAGAFMDRDEAYGLAVRLAGEGYETWVVREQ